MESVVLLTKSIGSVTPPVPSIVVVVAPRLISYRTAETRSYRTHDSRHQHEIVSYRTKSLDRIVQGFSDGKRRRNKWGSPTYLRDEWSPIVTIWVYCEQVIVKVTQKINGASSPTSWQGNVCDEIRQFAGRWLSPSEAVWTLGNMSYFSELLPNRSAEVHLKMLPTVTNVAVRGMGGSWQWLNIE